LGARENCGSRATNCESMLLGDEDVILYCDVREALSNPKLTYETADVFRALCNDSVDSPRLRLVAPGLFTLQGSISASCQRKRIAS